VVTRIPKARRRDKRALATDADRDAIVGLLGPKIARERAARGMSIEQVAERAGIATGLVSQLERGIGNPSLATLLGLASALEIPVGAFFEGAGGDGDMVVRKESRKRLVLSDRRMTYELLVPDLQGLVSMLHIELPAGFSNEDKPFAHAGEEAELILEGTVEAHIGSRVFLLNAGDSIRFSSAVPHWFRAFEEPVVVISAMTPPSF